MFRREIDSPSNEKPCIIQGTDPHGWMFPDGWTVSTEVCIGLVLSTLIFLTRLISQNCARSAQVEHMVLITETGAEVLTRTRSW